MPKTTQVKSTEITLKEVHYQDAVEVLEFAHTTFNQVVALLSSIQKAESLNDAQQLAALGGNYTNNMANYFDCAREDLEDAKL